MPAFFNYIKNIFIVILIGNLGIVIWKSYEINQLKRTKIKYEYDSKIRFRPEDLYLNEKYLRTIKYLFEHHDSKSIVDRPTKRPLNEVLEALYLLDEKSLTDIRSFVSEYLHDPGYEIKHANLTDWKEYPEFLKDIVNDTLKEFGLSLNKIWHDLYREVDYSKLGNDCVSSHLPMKHPFVVPGGRFIEMYYWDTYWTIEGLLISGMFDTARKMIENFMHFIDQYGFIPNGSRIYYLNRSQPPYFSFMVMKYYELGMSSKELNWRQKINLQKFVLYDALNYMIREYDFWMKERSIEVFVNNKKYKLNIFKANTSTPRPESYFEDLNTAKSYKTEHERMKLFQDIATAAESGYDFSSRWFKDPLRFETIQTSDIIPVDLNSLLYKTELIISNFFELKGDLQKSIEFKIKADTRKRAINELLWKPDNYSWGDFNIKSQTLNEEYYVTNLSPLWMGIEPPSINPNHLLNHHKNKLDDFLGGVPVSFINSSQQWDWPNAWAPNQQSIVVMLLKYDRNLSLSLARKFFNSVYIGWKQNKQIFEKYNALIPGKRGEGGEYIIQAGFGWTNGVLLQLIHLFKDELIV